MSQREYRFTAHELRVQTNDGQRTLTGYAAVFGSRSLDLGNWFEVIAPGAFAKSLRSNADVMCLSEHDIKKGILGRTKSGTLRLTEDNVGLRVECDLPDTTLGNDTATSIARGDLDGMSFGFVANDASWSEEKDGTILRTLKDVDVFDVTVTGLPAYPSTSVSMRSKLFPDGAVEIPAELRKEDPKPEPAPAPVIEAAEETNRLLASVIMRRVRSC